MALAAALLRAVPALGLDVFVDLVATGFLATALVFDFGAGLAVTFFAGTAFFAAADLVVAFLAALFFALGADLPAVDLPVVDLPVDFTADFRRPALFFSEMAAILQDRRYCCVALNQTAHLGAAGPTARQPVSPHFRLRRISVAEIGFSR